MYARGETMQIPDARYAAEADENTGLPYHRDRIDMAMRLLSGTSLHGKVVFDFGCGTGVFWRRLAREGATVIGCDTSEELLRHAPPGALLGGVEVLERQEAASVDVLPVLNVLSYFLKPEYFPRFWEAARRVVKPGGLLLQCHPNSLAANSKEYKFLTDPFTFPEILESYDFTEIATDFYGYYPYVFGHGHRINDPKKLQRIPTVLKRLRCTGYFSLSRRH